MSSSSGRRGGVVAAILIAVAVILMLAAAAAIGVGVYLARSVTVREARGQTVVETPFGTLRVRENAAFDPDAFGAPVYPGAVREEDVRKLASFELDFGDAHREFSIEAAQYTTRDSLEDVAAFYREKLPHWTSKSKRHGSVHFKLSGGGRTRIVAIREHHGVTHIGLASVGEPASN